MCSRKRHLHHQRRVLLRTDFGFGQIHCRQVESLRRGNSRQARKKRRQTFVGLSIDVNHEKRASGEHNSICSHSDESITKSPSREAPPSLPRSPPHLGGVHGRVHEEVEYLFVVDFHVCDGHAKGGFNPSIHFLEHVRQCSGRYAAVLWFRLHDNREPARGDGRHHNQASPARLASFHYRLADANDTLCRRFVRSMRVQPPGFHGHGLTTCPLVLFSVTSCLDEGELHHVFKEVRA